MQYQIAERQLGHFPVFIYGPVNIIICGECKRSITIASLRTHFARHHNLTLSSKDVKDLCLPAANESFDICEMGPIQHLSTQAGFQCSGCEYIAGHKKTMRNHLKDCHPERNKNDYSRVSFQQFYVGPQLCKIIVDDPENDVADSYIVDDSVVNDYLEPARTELPSAAYFTLWEKAFPMNERMICAERTLNIPDSLKELMLSYFGQIQEAIRKAPEFVRMSIMGFHEDDAPQSGKKFLTMLQNPQTVRKYANYAARYVAFLIRSLRANEEYIGMEAMEDPSELDEESLHQLLFRSVHHVFSDLTHEKDTALFKFVLASSADSTGKFNEPSRICSKIAQLKFLIRGTFALELLKGNISCSTAELYL